MLQNIDTALTYAAQMTMIGSVAYFAIAFVAFVMQAETQKSQIARRSTLPDRLPEVEIEPAPGQSDRALMLPENAALPSEIESAISDNLSADPLAQHAQSASLGEVLNDLSRKQSASDALGHEAADGSISERSEPSLKSLLEVGVLSAVRPTHQRAYMRQTISVPSIVIPNRQSAAMNVTGNEEQNANAVVEANLSEIDSDDTSENTSAKEDVTVLLPTISRSRLPIWSGYKQEKVVPIESIPFPIPEAIQRRRWRGTAVIRLADLETIATIV